MNTSVLGGDALMDDMPRGRNAARLATDAILDKPTFACDEKGDRTAEVCPTPQFNTFCELARVTR